MKSTYLLTLIISCSSLSVLSENLLTKRDKIEIESSPKYTKMLERFPYLETINFYEISYLSDSLSVNGYMIAPKEEGIYPGVIYNRGGNRDYGAYNFKMLIGTGLAEIASEGYVIALSQYRGNGGSEGKEEFGGADVNDVLNLIEVMNEVPEVDTSNLAMYGWSRGGMMTYQALIKTNKIKAVIVGGGSSDLSANLESRPGFEQGVYEELIPNYTENKEEELRKRSAINWVDKFPKDVPILILHGGSDGNVRPQQALKLALELDEHRVPYKLLIFEGDNHGIKNNRNQVQTEIKTWLNRYLVQNENLPDMDYRISN